MLHLDQFRPDFVKMLATLEKKNEAIVLGGDSFPFGTSTFYLNCDDIETATRFANDVSLAACRTSS
jgi:hypothetical protein